MENYTSDYLLDNKVVILQPKLGYRASSDAVLVASAVDNVKDKDSILDIGSGTGAISLCLAHRLKDKNVNITGLEVQKDLAELSNKSAELNGFDFLNFINTDIKKHPLEFCSFNHVITNPPYGQKDMASPMQGKSLAHNFSSVPTLDEWIQICIKMVKPRGYFYIINRAEALGEILHSCYGRLGEIKVIPLYSKHDQPAKRVIVVGKKNSKAALSIEAGIVIHDEGGNYTSAAQNILRLGLGLRE